MWDQGSKEGLRGLYNKIYFLEIWKELDFMRKYIKMTVISVKLKATNLTIRQNELNEKFFSIFVIFTLSTFWGFHRQKKRYSMHDIQI